MIRILVVMLGGLLFAQAGDALTLAEIYAAENATKRKVSEIKAQNRDVTSGDLAEFLCPLYFPREKEDCLRRVEKAKPASAILAAPHLCGIELDCLERAADLISASVSNPDFRTLLNLKMDHLEHLSRTVRGEQSSHGDRLARAFREIDGGNRLERSLMLGPVPSQRLGWPPNPYFNSTR